MVACGHCIEGWNDWRLGRPPYESASITCLYLGTDLVDVCCHSRFCGSIERGGRFVGGSSGACRVTATANMEVEADVHFWQFRSVKVFYKSFHIIFSLRETPGWVNGIVDLRIAAFLLFLVRIDVTLNLPFFFWVPGVYRIDGFVDCRFRKGCPDGAW